MAEARAQGTDEGQLGKVEVTYVREVVGQEAAGVEQRETNVRERVAGEVQTGVADVVLLFFLFG